MAPKDVHPAAFGKEYSRISREEKERKEKEFKLLL
jgi:hypothetical protein